MKKFFVFIVGLFVVGTVFAVGENIPTSKTYVDNAVAQKQNTISANNGNAQVLTNTGTPGSIGTKNIYDSSAAYETQTNSLVTAGTMNTAVQNAIDSEFVCIEHNAQGECLLLEIRAVPQQSILPTGYTALEYIESTGEQYLDIGMKNLLGTNPFIIRTTVSTTETGGNRFGVFFGNKPSYSRTQGFSIYLNHSVQNLILYARNNENRIDNSNFYNGAFHDFVATYNGNGAGTFVIDGTTYNFSSLSTDTVDNGTNYFVFATNDAGIPVNFFQGKAKNIAITVNNILIINLIPARRDSDGVLGMYDTVTNTFFTNSGTGEFIAGPVSHLYLPSGN